MIERHQFFIRVEEDFKEHENYFASIMQAAVRGAKVRSIFFLHQKNTAQTKISLCFSILLPASEVVGGLLMRNFKYMIVTSRLCGT